MKAITNRSSRSSAIYKAVKITAKSSPFDRVIDLIDRGVVFAATYERAEVPRMEALPAYRENQKTLEGQAALDAKGVFFKAQKNPAIAAFSAEVVQLIKLRHDFRENVFEAGKVQTAAAQAEMVKRVAVILPALKTTAMNLGQQTDNNVLKAYAADVESLAALAGKHPSPM
jgi:hypothetical protein